jgi:hypothetical protein
MLSPALHAIRKPFTTGKDFPETVGSLFHGTWLVSMPRVVLDESHELDFKFK